MWASSCRSPLTGSDGFENRRRVPRDNRGTSSQSGDFFRFEDFQRLEPGSIPAASTNFSTKAAACVAAFSFEARIRVRARVAVE